MINRLLPTFKLFIAASTRVSFAGWLIFVSFLAYLLQIYLNATSDFIKLYSLGAFTTFSVTYFGDWHRLLVAPFLHYNLYHLIFNVSALVVMLYILYRYIDNNLFWKLYLSSALGSFFLLLGLAQLGVRADGLCFGLWLGLSGVLAFLLDNLVVKLSRQNSKLSKKLYLYASACLWITAIELGQAYFFPNLSHLAHVLGYLIGFLVAKLYAMRFRKTVQKRKPRIRSAVAAR